MTETISLPIWIAVAAAALVLWAVLDRVFIPGARWVLRRRANRAIDELNTRLKLRIPAFHRTRRQVLVERLVGDPEMTESLEHRHDHEQRRRQQPG